MYPKGCFSGNYRPDTSYPKDFNNIIALEFGAPQSPTRPGRVNLAIADYLIANVVNPKLHQTLFVSQSIADALSLRKLYSDHYLSIVIVNPGSSQFFGNSQSTNGERYDSYEHIANVATILQQRQNNFRQTSHSKSREWTKHQTTGPIAPNACLVVTAAHLAGRCQQQAQRLGLKVRLPHGLPKAFDPESPQIWCRHPITWILREILAIPYLYLIHRL